MQYFAGTFNATFRCLCLKYLQPFAFVVAQVYLISKGSLKTADKRFNSGKNEYEMTFNADTQVTLCEEEGNLPTMKFNFIKIGDLLNHEPDSLVGT